MLCLECGQERKALSYKHLQSCCGLTPQQYREKHPGAELVDADVRPSFGVPKERNGRWKGGLADRVCEVCGGKIGRYAKTKRCHRCKQFGRPNAFAGKQHTDATKERMRIAAARRDPSTYTAHGNYHLLEQGRAKYWATVSPEQKYHHLQKFITAGQLHNKRSTKTKIENIVATWLDQTGVLYTRNHQVGRYNVDFLIGNLIVECYGDFWHCNPIIWQADSYNRSLHLTAQQKWERDARRLAVLQQRGYNTLVVWEYDIYNNAELAQQGLNNALNK